MKYIWEEKDVVCGIFVYKPICNVNKDRSWTPDRWTAKWTHKIGFIGGSSKGTVLISMTDGMVGTQKTPAEMAEYLNNTELIPMPHNRLIKMMNYLRDSY